jgi:acetyl-CoA C-acetyltransferase
MASSTVGKIENTVFIRVSLNTRATGGVNPARAKARSGVVDEVLMGCVLPAGQGQAPARQAGFAAGLGEEVPATTLNKMCGSGMKAAMIAFDQIALGHAASMVAGGMESMTNAPYLLPKMRGGARIGHAQVHRPHVPRRAGGRL